MMMPTHTQLHIGEGEADDEESIEDAHGDADEV